MEIDEQVAKNPNNIIREITELMRDLSTTTQEALNKISPETESTLALRIVEHNLKKLAQGADECIVILNKSKTSSKNYELHQTCEPRTDCKPRAKAKKSQELIKKKMKSEVRHDEDANLKSPGQNQPTDNSKEEKPLRLICKKEKSGTYSTKMKALPKQERKVDDKLKLKVKDDVLCKLEKYSINEVHEMTNLSKTLLYRWKNLFIPDFKDNGSEDSYITDDQGSVLEKYATRLE